jgi:hypothetical protein
MAKKGIKRRDFFKLGGFLPAVPGLIKGLFEIEPEAEERPEPEYFDHSACPVTIYPPGWSSLNQDLSQGWAGSASVGWMVFPDE